MLARAYAKLGLPFWLGVVVTAFVPLSAVAFLDYFFVPYDIIDGVGGVVAYSAYIIYLLFAVRFTLDKVGDLQNHANSMSLGRTAVEPSSGHNLLGTLVILSILGGGLFLVEGVPAPSQLFQEHLLATGYLLLILSYFIWVYGNSMLAIYRMGKLPLQLKLYTEDRTLGLRLFGTTSLRLTSVYSAFPVSILLVSIALSNLTLSDIVIVTGMMLAGFALFFLPLLSIHRKLQQAKRNELGWVLPRYTRIITQLKQEEANGNRAGMNRETVANELLMIRSIQQDIHQIHTWPIDVSIVTRLVTVLALPPLLGVVARVLVLVFIGV